MKMADIKDDPRQVLALLNSLGFVGITGEQLKAFMKDLKMYRKIKERERQKWKDEMKQRILQKQKAELAELLTKASDTNIHTQEPDVSVVEIQIQRASDNETNDDVENEVTKSMPLERQSLPKKNEDTPIEVEVSDRLKNSSREICTVKTLRDVRNMIPLRPVSAPDLSKPHVKTCRPKSISSEPTKMQESLRNPSRCSSRSQSKSFIRPWRLNPESQRAPQSTKSDPVTLYQNYQKGWKQISFPGENQHANIRWAVREKMLGTDPTPKPILKKSCSTLSVKRR